MDRRQEQPLDRPRHRQSHLATVFRTGIGNDARRFRLAMRAPVPSRIARLAGGRVHRKWVEHETYSPIDLELRRLEAISKSQSAAVGGRSVQPLAGASAANPRRI